MNTFKQDLLFFCFLRLPWSYNEKVPTSKYTEVFKFKLRKGRFKKKIKKWLDLSNAHLTPASQAERWIKKFKNSTIFFYVFIIIIITIFGENFEEEKMISASFKMFWGEKWMSKSLTNSQDFYHDHPNNEKLKSSVFWMN